MPRYYKVTVRGVEEGRFTLTIHNFLTEPEARAYIMGIKEFGDDTIIKIEFNGREV